MQYMLLITSEPAAMAALSPAEARKMAGDYATLTRSLADSGELVANAPLEGTDTATTVRLRGDEPVPSDGPFAETKEYLCGFYLLDCADLDRAIEVAGQVPGLGLGSVEVRPVRDFPQLPGSS
jgi:hypothetical protein